VRVAGISRQIGLVAVVFLATLVVLVGVRAALTRVAPGAIRPSGSPTATSGGSLPPGVSPTPRPTVPPAVAPNARDAPTFTLIGAGDIANCATNGANQTADLLAREPGWIFTTGDNAYENGSTADYERCYGPTWGRFLDRTILPAAGNHDWNTKGAAGYVAYFGAKAAPDGPTWYSRDIGTWHIVVLDSDCAAVGGCDAGSAQGRWLAADLRASAATCTLAIWHHPRFSSGEHGDNPAVGPFWEALWAHGAELIVNGHDHDYERFAPQDPSGSERAVGLREIVAGTGGGELRKFTHAAPNSDFRHERTYGVLRLTLAPNSYEWRFLPAAGGIGDAGITACH
jgi:hypothetical protein